MTHALRVLAATAIIVLAGCKGGTSESTVSGTVKYKGKPLGNGYVLLRFDNGNEVKGDIAIDGSGNYTVKSTFQGHAKIAVGSPKPGDPSAKKGRGDSAPDPSTMPDPKKWVAIPEKYSDPDQSGKETTVSSGSTKYDIELD